jgi:ethanolamine utilization protein EutN
MIVGRVVGSIVSTVKHSAYASTKLLLVEPLSLDGTVAGPEIVCVDTVGAGAGELVLVCKEGAAARQVLNKKHAPVRSLVIGVIDQVERMDGSALTLASIS